MRARGLAGSTQVKGILIVIENWDLDEQLIPIGKANAEE